MINHIVLENQKYVNGHWPCACNIILFILDQEMNKMMLTRSRCALRAHLGVGKNYTFLAPRKNSCACKAVSSGGGGGGGGGGVAPQKCSKQKQTYTQILDFLIVVSVDQNIVQLK